MRKIQLMLPSVLAVWSLYGCGATSTPKTELQQAFQTNIIDVSASVAAINDSTYADRAVTLLGQEIEKLKTGDGIQTLLVGDRSIEKSGGSQLVKTGIRKRVKTARKEVEQFIRNALANQRQSGGDDSTNILYYLENAHPVCSSRSKIVILSDGIEDSDAYSASAALRQGKPITLPAPSTPYLKGCTITFIGIGVSPKSGAGAKAETLSNAQVQALIGGWSAYFQSAGVSAADIRFTTIVGG